MGSLDTLSFQRHTYYLLLQQVTIGKKLLDKGSEHLTYDTLSHLSAMITAFTVLSCRSIFRKIWTRPFLSQSSAFAASASA